MKEKEFTAGIDIGSTTVKLVILDGTASPYSENTAATAPIPSSPWPSFSGKRSRAWGTWRCG